MKLSRVILVLLAFSSPSCALLEGIRQFDPDYTPRSERKKPQREIHLKHEK